MNNPFTQKILFLKVKNQDPEAYGKFYDLYVERIYRFIFFKVNSAPDAQDLTSEVFLKLWQYLKEGRTIRNLNAFVYLVARNTVIDFYREKSRNIEITEERENLPDLPDDNQDLINQKLKESDLEGVLKGLNNLKDEYKEVIVLKFLDELSISEISQILNKSQGAVRVLIHRALKALKDNVKENAK